MCPHSYRRWFCQWSSYPAHNCRPIEASELSRYRSASRSVPASSGYGTGYPSPSHRLWHSYCRPQCLSADSQIHRTRHRRTRQPGRSAPYPHHAGTQWSSGWCIPVRSLRRSSSGSSAASASSGSRSKRTWQSSSSPWTYPTWRYQCS